MESLQIVGSLGDNLTDRPAGIVIAMLFVSVPFRVNSSREAFAGVDRDIGLASLVDGANSWQMFPLGNPAAVLARDKQAAH